MDRLVILGRNTELVVYDEVGREKLRQKLPNGTRLRVEPDAQVDKGQVLAEWDPHTLPVITEASGIIVFQDLIDGTSFREVVDEATGKTSKEVIDWRQNARSGNLRPSIVLQDEHGNPITLPSGSEARYYLPVGAIMSVENGLKVHAGDVLARLPREASKTRDITGGLPRVAELFEARRPKDPAIIAEIEGRIEFGKDYKNKRRLRILPADEDLEPVEYLIPKGRHVVVQEGDQVKPGDLIVDGNPVPHDLLRVLGVEALAQFLVNEIQEVYKLQGVKINDKHIEVIVRQMLQKIEIVDPGDTTFLVGEQVDRLGVRPDQRSDDRRGPAAGDLPSGAAGHHQGEPADAVVHLGGVVPGDHARADRCGVRRQGRQAAGPQGERHRRPADPGRHRRRAAAVQEGGRDRRQLRGAAAGARGRRPAAAAARDERPAVGVGRLATRPQAGAISPACGICPGTA